MTPVSMHFFAKVNNMPFGQHIHTCIILIYISHLDKRQRILKGQSKMENPKNLATHVTQDEEKQNKNITKYVQTNTNNVNKL